MRCISMCVEHLCTSIEHVCSLWGRRKWRICTNEKIVSMSSCPKSAVTLRTAIALNKAPARLGYLKVDFLGEPPLEVLGDTCSQNPQCVFFKRPESSRDRDTYKRATHGIQHTAVRREKERSGHSKNVHSRVYIIFDSSLAHKCSSC